MPFRPNVGDTLLIEGVLYSIAEHPSAPRIPYGQEGRAAIVYQIVAGEEKRAIKVFKARYQMPSMVTLAERIGGFATMPGLRVCKRTVITARRHIEVIREHPDLTYSVLMPWIEGPTWMEALLYGYQFTPERSLRLGRAMVEVLAEMEERGLAHCDLSGPNILIPALAEQPSPGSLSPIELVDVEQMYAPGLEQPEYIPSGSSGYAHRTAPAGLWHGRADRFAGAVLVAEMLAWCDERVRSASWGESYFDPEEMQQECERYEIITSALREHWGDGAANLLEQAWRSDVLADCPTFARWLAALPDQISARLPAQAPVVQPFPEVAGVSIAPAASPAESTALAQQAVQGEEAELASLFDDGLAAYNQGKWAEARELLTEVVRQRADYARAGVQAGLLLAGAERQMAGRAPVQPIIEPQLAAAETAAAAAQPVPVQPVPTADGHSEPGLPLPGVPVASTPAQPATVENAAVPRTTTRQARPVSTKPGQGRKWLWIVPVVLVVVALLAFGGIAAYQAQLAAQATATQTAQTAQAEASATAEVAAAETAQVEGVTQTVVAQVTATEEALVAASTQQAEAGATRQVSEAATVEAEARGTALSVQAILTASPRPAAFSVENKDRIAPLRTLRGHVNGVGAVAFSPDGQMLATSSQDKKIRLWKVADGSLLRTLVGQEEAITSMAFAPGGHLLASASYDGIRLWEVETGVEIGHLQEHQDLVKSLAFSPDGTLLASGSADKTARIWRLADRTTLHTLEGHQEEVTGVAFSPDGKSLATGSMDSTVRIWNVGDGTLIRALSGPKGDLLKPGATSRGPKGENVQTDAGIVSVAFSPDGKRLAAGVNEPEGTDRTVCSVWLWTVDDGVPERVLSGPDAPVYSLVFSPDGQVLATTGSYQGKIGLWRVSDGAILRILEGHVSLVSRLAFSPDGQLLASGSDDDMVVLWGLPQGNETPTPAPVQAGIGGTAELGGLKITLNSVRHAQQGVTKNDGSAAEPGDSNEFLFANVTLENTTDKGKPVYVPGEFKVYNTWRNVTVPVDSTGEATIPDSLKDKAGEELAPHAKVTGEIGFRLGQQDKDLTLEYLPMLSPGTIVFKLDR